MSGSTKRTVGMAVLLIVIALTAFCVMVYQVVAQGERLHEQLTALEAQNVQDDSYYRLLRLAEETVGDRVQLQQYFLQRESDSINFLNHIETIAPEAGVALEINSLDTLTEKSGETAWIKVTFDFSGTRHNVQNFIQILETLPYVQRLTSVEINARSSNDWQASVTMQVRVLVLQDDFDVALSSS